MFVYYGIKTRKASVPNTLKYAKRQQTNYTPEHVPKILADAEKQQTILTL